MLNLSTKIILCYFGFLEKPGKPENLGVKKASSKSICLTWDAPADDGGAAILNCVIEYRREGNDLTILWLNSGNFYVSTFRGFNVEEKGAKRSKRHQVFVEVGRRGKSVRIQS